MEAEEAGKGRLDELEQHGDAHQHQDVRQVHHAGPDVQSAELVELQRNVGIGYEADQAAVGIGYDAGDRQEAGDHPRHHALAGADAVVQVLADKEQAAGQDGDEQVDEHYRPEGIKYAPAHVEYG